MKRRPAAIMPGREAQDLVSELGRVVADERVLAAMRACPREAFVPQALRDQAYANVALPIAHEQTISQPLVVARMLELLELTPTDRVLDVGTGSGYHAVLLGMLAAEVWSIERCAALSAQARAIVARLGQTNITCVIGDGSRGLDAHAPYDAINVAAGAPTVPEALERQLAVGGRMVIPAGVPEQHLVRVRRTPDGLISERYEAVRFVPLVQG